jgi:Domain of unknown function (DUF4383)
MSTELPSDEPASRRVQTQQDRRSDTDPQQHQLYAAPVQRAAMAVALVFGLVGVAGFIPGLTSNIGALEFAGHHSGALLFGLFTVSVLHNVVHLVFAMTGLAMAIGPAGARAYLLVGGVIYLLLTLYGVLVPQAHPANFIPVNTADDVLHLALGVGMIGLGLLSGRTER